MCHYRKEKKETICQLNMALVSSRSDIRKNKEMSMKFADILETNKRLKRKSLKVAHDEQFDKALYAWVYSATNIWQSNFWSPNNF